MVWKIVLAAVTVLVQQDVVSAEFTMIPSTTTAAELWNPYTWFWPYAIASAESYSDYFKKAQKATNELYQQIYATNANPFITGNWGGASAVTKPDNNAGSNNTTQSDQSQNDDKSKPDETNESGGKDNTDDQSKDQASNTTTTDGK